jgi:hypothetical protein
MKPSTKSQRLFITAALTLAVSAGLCRAADITYTFGSDTQGWYAADGHGSVVWDATNGRGGGGCLKFTLPVGGTELNPRVDVVFDTTGYFAVEFDIRVDSSSGTTGGGNYGNLQVVARSSGWSWDSMWIGAVDSSFNSYRRIKRAFTSNYGEKAYLQIQLAGGPYSDDLIVYIDNVVIRDGTPPEEAVMHDFAVPESVTMGVSSWGSGIVVSHDTSAAPLRPEGSLKFVANYAGGGGWQEAVVQLAPYQWDPSKFTWLEFDVYLDAPTGQAGYGILNVFQITSGWGWQGIGGTSFSEADIGTWKRVKRPLTSMSSSQGIIIQAGGSFASPSTFTYYIDNIVVWQPADPPTLTRLEPGTPRGVRITMDDDGSQWQRDGIASPEGNSYSWVGQTPATYGFTIAEFPSATQHPGFEAHLYLASDDTGPGTWNQTFGAADWNAADIAIFRVQNIADGTVSASFHWKTNLPNSNPPGDEVNNPVTLTGVPTAVGDWTLTFHNDTDGTITGPGGVSGNFSLPADVPAASFNPFLLFLQFGVFKNDGANSGINNRKSATFSRVWMTNSTGVVFDDNFSGPDLTANYAWRKTRISAVNWTPTDTAWWLSWTTPDGGAVPYVAGVVTGPYADAGSSHIYQIGTSKTAAIPGANLPAGNAAFFGLGQRQFTKLQILLPGETAAPGTPTGKTGTPDPQGNTQQFVVTVRAVDADWFPISGVSHVISLSSSAGNDFMYSGEAAMANGVVTFDAAFFASGSFTITAEDVTDDTKTPDTSPAITVN